MDVFERVASSGHEQVVFCHDRASGLRAIIAIHSTVLGPALGGCRFYPYAREQDALEDVLRLSRAMTYKSAAAGLDLGGGKAVIIGDAAKDRSESLIRAYGRFVDGLGGRYFTAEDVGTTMADMDLIRRETRFVTGVSPSLGGSGDPSPITAIGVLHALRATARHRWGSDDLAGRHVVVVGVGKVGKALVEHLVSAGARVTVADVNRTAVHALVARHGVAAAEPEDAHRLSCDVLAPCALAGALSRETIPEMRCEVVVGAANNQLADPGCAQLLADAGITWCPDFIANAGGIVNIAEEPAGYDRDRALGAVARIADTATTVLELAAAEGVTTAEAANRLAERRIEAMAAVQRIRTSPR